MLSQPPWFLSLFVGSLFVASAGAEPLTVAITADRQRGFVEYGEYLEKTFDVKVIWVEAKKGGEVLGTEKLADADVMLFNLYRTEPTREQLKNLQAYFLSGKPVVGLRKASHAIQNWLVIDREVFGAKYGGHFLQNKQKELGIWIVDGQKKNPLVAGFDPFLPGGGLYKYTELADDVTVLMEGGLGDQVMPQCWTRINEARQGQRVLYLRYDPDDLRKSEGVRDLVTRGLFWASGRDAKPRRE